MKIFRTGKEKGKKILGRNRIYPKKGQDIYRRSEEILGFFSFGSLAPWILLSFVLQGTGGLESSPRSRFRATAEGRGEG